MSQGWLITLEGGEGAGKSTLLRGLQTHLQARGVTPLLTREPGGTELGERVRELVLAAPADTVTAEAELLLMFAARAQLVREVLQPALAAGQCVLCDRFVDASFAYQGGGRGQPEARIDALAQWALAGVEPDLTLLLDLPVAAGHARIRGRGQPDRIEAENQAFFERVRAAYRQRAAAAPARFRVLDARQPPAVVLAAATTAVDALMAGAVQ